MKEKPDKLLKDIGALIKKLRLEKGLTSVEFGYRCEMDKPNVNRLEKGNTNPTFLTLIRICKALEIELNDLFKDFKTPKDE
jgi:transcriptional regulator with XRE-family HTH domain